MILAAVFLLVFSAFTANSQEKITLQQAVDLTLQNNLQIKQSKLNEALSEEDLKQSKLYFYPTLNASTDLNYNFGRNIDPVSNDFVNEKTTTSSGGVNSSFPVFQGFRLWNQISRFKYQLEADKSATKKIQNDLSLTVVTTYLQILNNEDLLTASQQQFELAKLQLDREQKQFDVGSKTLADLSQAKSQMATAELNVTTARNQLDISYLNLAQLMERDPANPFEVVKPAINQLVDLNSTYSAAEVYTKASENYPDINIAKFRTLAALKAVDIAKGDLYPRLTFGANMSTGYSSRKNLVQGELVTAKFSDQISDNFRQTVGFTLSIPIFNNYSSRIGLRKAKISYQNAQVSEQLARNNFNKIIYQAVTDLRAAESSYNSANSAYQSSKDAFNAIQQRYGVGLVNSLDFNQAQTDLNQKEFNLIQARYNLIFRNKIIDFYLGNPLTF
ncbi:TolC family protein [Arcticibacter tournemirensis]